MRIITGTARGVKLRTLEGAEITRPTTEVAKEGMFSAIQFELHDRRVLDLFGGCGQLALEALSRGAANAVICDVSREAVAVIKENAQKTRLMPQCRILGTDWKDYLRGAKGRDSFDLVILDPPYQAGILDEVLQGLLEADLLTEHALILCESAQDGVPLPLPGFRQKLYRYGKSYVSLYRREADEEDE